MHPATRYGATPFPAGLRRVSRVSARLPLAGNQNRCRPRREAGPHKNEKSMTAKTAAAMMTATFTPGVATFCAISLMSMSNTRRTVRLDYHPIPYEI